MRPCACRALGLRPVEGERQRAQADPRPRGCGQDPQVQRTVDSVGSCYPSRRSRSAPRWTAGCRRCSSTSATRSTSGRALVKIVPVELGLDASTGARGPEADPVAPDRPRRRRRSQGPQAKRPRCASARRGSHRRRAEVPPRQGAVRPRASSRKAPSTRRSRATTSRAPAYDMAVQNVLTLRAQAAQRTRVRGAGRQEAGRRRHPRAVQRHVKDQRLVSPGQYVKIQTPVMVIVDADPTPRAPQGA